MNENEYVDINAHDNYPDSDQKLEIHAMKVLPLKKICMTIGELPTSYLETMTYYEMLVWFIEYLRNTIIPTINNNSEAVQEVQSVVLELQNYINEYKDSIDEDVEELETYMNDYFENLDVQEEINNKLDEMVQDGTFQELIDGYTTIPELTSRVQTLENKEKTEMIVIGDSYSSRTYLPDTTKKLWCEIVADRFGLNLHNFADPGAGFIADGDERQSTFSSQIDEAYNDTSFSNNKVKYVFIYGGTNDLRYANTNSKASFNSAFDNTFQNARNKYPKANIVYLGCSMFSSFYPKPMSDGETITELWVDTSIKERQTVKDCSIVFGDLTLFHLGQDAYFTDGYAGHPNYKAHKDFSDAVFNVLFSSSNAFVHQAITTPTATSQSSEYITFGNTLSQQNQWVLIITNTTIKMKLTTYMAIPTRQNFYKLNIPFNLIIPYSASDKFTYKNYLVNTIIFGESHNEAGIVKNGLNTIQFDRGANNFTVYNDLSYTSYSNYDLYFECIITY